MRYSLLNNKLDSTLSLSLTTEPALMVGRDKGIYRWEEKRTIISCLTISAVDHPLLNTEEEEKPISSPTILIFIVRITNSMETATTREVTN